MVVLRWAGGVTGSIAAGIERAVAPEMREVNMNGARRIFRNVLSSAGVNVVFDFIWKFILCDKLSFFGNVSIPLGCGGMIMSGER